MQTAVETWLGPIRLADGVRRHNALNFIVVAIASIGLLLFLNFMQPYLLTGQIRNAAPSALGRITGRLSVMQELIVLALVGPLGSLSDRVGRPAVFAAGLALLSGALFALTAVTSVAALTAVRVLFACGAAAAAATLAANFWACCLSRSN
jgi:MFS family permease